MPADAAATHPSTEPEPDYAPPSPRAIVGIGVGADALDSLTALFGVLPRTDDLAFVVVAPTPAAGASPARPTPTALVDALKRVTALEVESASTGPRLTPGRVYVATGDAYPTVSDGRLHCASSSASGLAPIDQFLESLASDCTERSIAVILEGAGQDGALGVRAVKDRGGVVLAQRPEGTALPEMPANAIATGLVDQVLDPAAIAASLVEVAQRRRADGRDREALSESSGGADEPNGSKRVGPAILPRIKSSGNGELSPQVPRFPRLFNDPPAWSALRQHVIERLLRDRPSSVPLRVWVPQCATGEDAFTVALLIAEVLDDLDARPEVKIFATDVDEDALIVARAGLFRRADVESLNVERRSSFAREGDQFRVLESVRSNVVFARHDLLRDPPFLHLDLIVCRDLLRRADGAMQNRILQIFSRSLASGGALFLGAADTVGAQKSELLFDAVDRRWRVFRRTGPHRLDPELVPPLIDAEPAGIVQRSLAHHFNYGQMLRAALIERYAPASVLVDRELRVLHFLGPTGDFIAPPKGAPTTSLLAMLREGLAEVVEEAVGVAIEERSAVRVRAADAALPDDRRAAVVVTALPLEPLSARATFVVVSFELDYVAETPTSTFDWVSATAASEREPDSPRPVPAGRRSGREPRIDLDDEAESTRDQLQWAVEDLRTANEELESSREELQSMNEELLGMNERVMGVNSELEGKVRELESTTNDLANLLDGTAVATVFLDRDRRVRRFTRAVHGLIELRSTDLGRPLSHFRVALQDETLMDDLDRVLASSEPAEAIARGNGDQWFLRRIVPYRTGDGNADGVVITFTDITRRHQAEQSLLRINAELDDRVKRRTALIRLLQDVAVIANDAGPMERAFAATLERICRDESWTAGHVYVVHAGVAEDSQIWHVEEPARGRRMQALLGRRSFGPGEGLVGQVINDGQPAWSSDLAADERFRGVNAKSLGVRSALVFPILIGERVVGAFEFFSSEKREPGPGLIEVMRNVGTQLGRVIEREEARARAFDLAIEEQRSLGEELHDTLSQQIHGLSMLAQSMVPTLSAAGVDDGRTRALVDGLVDAHRQIRVLSSGLVPVRVEAGGLHGALEEMARDWERMHGTECLFEHVGGGDPDDEQVATALYRIAREAARNAALHGAAQRIVIRLEATDGQIQLEIHDDGQGMAQVPVAGPGMGLQIMRHRAEQIGGTLEIESAPGTGTWVRCKVGFAPEAGPRGAGGQP